MKKATGSYPRPSVDTRGRAAVGQAAGVLLTSTVRAAGLDVALSTAMAPWRPELATHDPAKVLLDLAITLALGGDTCSDLAVVRAVPDHEGTRQLSTHVHLEFRRPSPRRYVAMALARNVAAERSLCLAFRGRSLTRFPGRVF